jgi:hypothetical protein
MRGASRTIPGYGRLWSDREVPCDRLRAINPKLLERQSRGLIEKRRQAVGALPGVEEFAAAIVQAGISETYSSGETIYVGSTELS